MESTDIEISNKAWLYNELKDITEKAQKDIDFILQIRDPHTQAHAKLTLLKSFVINLESLIEDCQAKEGSSFDLIKFKQTTVEMVKKIVDRKF